MRKMFLPVLLLCMLCLTAMSATDPQDITARCRLSGAGGREGHRAMTDGAYKSTWETADRPEATLEIQLPPGTAEGGLYLRFNHIPAQWTLTDENGVLLARGDDRGFPHVYLPFQRAQRLHLWMQRAAGARMGIAELSVLEGKEPPAWVQRWLPTYEQADLLVLVAHPDDDLLFMGGAVPWYAVEEGRRVVVAYMTCQNPQRRTEALNALWEAGVRHYPVFGDFFDKQLPREDVWRRWGEENTLAFVTNLYRRFKPQVVISHDLNGEYGHGAHKVTAEAARNALALAADSAAFPDSASQYGLWDVPKLYLHLYAQDELIMDWRRPISAQRRTALEAAQAAFKHHKSQNHDKYQVKDTGPHSSARFGLVRSLVGPDKQKDSFFENIRGR